MYELVLFLHLLTIAVAFFAMGSMLTSIFRLRGATSVAAARSAAATAAGIGKMMPILTVFMLATGGYLTQVRWTWTTPWIDLSIVGLLVVTAWGGGVMGARERAVHHALESSRGSALDAGAARLVVDPFLVIGNSADVGLVAGVMFVMVLKPSLAGGIAALVVATACGAIAGAAAVRPREALHAVTPETVEA